MKEVLVMVDYMEKINDDDLKELYKLIGIKTIKSMLKTNNRLFSRIKPGGFRVESLSDDEVISLMVKNRCEFDIKKYANHYCDEMLKKMAVDSVEDKKNIVEKIRQSPLAKNIDLFFRLCDTKFSETEKDEIKKLVFSGANRTYEGVRALQNKLKIASNENSKLKNIIKSLQDSLNERDKMVSALQERIDVADNMVTYAANTSENYQYRSICKIEDNCNYVIRLADITADGYIEKFIQNKDEDKYFSNRKKIYRKDGPQNSESVAVWDWSPERIANDVRDYVKSKYIDFIMPIEIILVPNCYSIKDLTNILQNQGVYVEKHITKCLLSIKRDNEQIEAVFLEEKEYNVSNCRLKINEDVFKVRVYTFNKNQVVELDNQKDYYYKVEMGIPNRVEKICSDYDIVRYVILSNGTWPVFKELGVTRNQWQIAKKFIEYLNKENIIKDIAAKVDCSEKKAEQLLDEFKANVDKYIDGNTIEDSVLSAAIRVNDDLMSRCQSLLREEWEANNTEMISAERDKITQVKEELATKKSDLADVRYNLQECKNKLIDVEKTIALKTQFADSIEKEVHKRIKQAKSEVDKFITDIFFSNAYLTSDNQHGYGNDTVGASSCKKTDSSIISRGIVLDKQSVIQNDTWKDVLEIIEENLKRAGVKKEYSSPFASFLYSAYLQHIPVLLAGPNSSEIVDAVSAAVLGCMSDALNCVGEPDISALEKVFDESNGIIKIKNAFNSTWIPHLLDFAANKEKYCFLVHPYVEDLIIEPKGVFSYIMPVFTDLLIDEMPRNIVEGGVIGDPFDAFYLDRINPARNNAALKHIKLSHIVKKKYAGILNNMGKMLDMPNINDYSVLFAVLPYAYVTNQLPSLLDKLQNREIEVSREVINEIEYLYGDGV